MNPGNSTAFVEAQPLCVALSVADAVAKSADVTIVSIEHSGAGAGQIKITGSTAAVEAACRAGADVAERMHGLVGATVLRTLDRDVMNLMVPGRQEFSGIFMGNLHMMPQDDEMDRMDHGVRQNDAEQRSEGSMKKSNAIGMVETQGLTGMIEAADAMMKAAAVELIGMEKIGAAYVTIMVEGDVAAVTAAVEAGKAAAERVGKVISTNVIAHPHEALARLLPKPVAR
jgi:microcompartment protein CcmL/EutN